MKRASLFAAVAAILLVAFPLLATPISMGPQAMEGNLKLSPGDLLMAGYDFTIPGSHRAATSTARSSIRAPWWCRISAEEERSRSATAARSRPS